jgi:hypothetical protein
MSPDYEAFERLEIFLRRPRVFCPRHDVLVVERSWRVGMTIEDETWARRFRGGDTQALEEAIGEFGPSMQALVSRVLAGAGSGEDAEECVSDAFLAAWHGIDRYDRSKGSFRTWLLLLAKYTGGGSC